MGDWGTLDPADNEPQQTSGGGAPSARAGSWGELDGGHDGSAIDAQGYSGGTVVHGRPQTSDSRWGSLDGQCTEVSGSGSDATKPLPTSDRAEAQSSRANSANSRLPPPEATASLLEEGEILWARVDRSGVRLGSGQQLLVTEGDLHDQEGWCRVEVVDPARLAVRVLPVAWAPLRSGVGTNPALVYRAASPDDAQEVDRVPPFPVGQGPDLRAMFEERVAAARFQAEQRGKAAERRADERVAEIERKAEQAADARVRAAESRAQADVARIEREGSERARRLQIELERLSKATQRMRAQQIPLAVAAGVGWLLVLLLWIGP